LPKGALFPTAPCTATIDYLQSRFDPVRVRMSLLEVSLGSVCGRFFVSWDTYWVQRTVPLRRVKSLWMDGLLSKG